MLMPAAAQRSAEASAYKACARPHAKARRRRPGRLLVQHEPKARGWPPVLVPMLRPQIMGVLGTWPKRDYEYVKILANPASEATLDAVATAKSGSVLTALCEVVKDEYHSLIDLSIMEGLSKTLFPERLRLPATQVLAFDADEAVNAFPENTALRSESLSGKASCGNLLIADGRMPDA